MVVTGQRHDFLPFGESIPAGLNGRLATDGYGASENLSVLNKLFTGKERDAETNLDYFGARYMSAAQGRFSSPDPFIPIGLKPKEFLGWISNPQRWNRYAYALNNPLRFIDPTGLNACGTNDDKNCKVEVEISARHTDKSGAYDDQFKGVKNQNGYNAVATVKVNGEVVGTFLAKTTSSDSSRFATTASGTYSAALTQHRGNPAIRLQPTLSIPTAEANPSRADHRYVATGILVHRSGLENFTGVGTDGRAVSEGCQIIPRSQYPDFLNATGITPSDGSAPQSHFIIRMDTPQNRLYADPVPSVPEG